MPYLAIIRFFELSGFIAFGIIVARELFQKNWWKLFEIFSCAVFGMILEIGDSHWSGGYSYSSHFAIQIFNVPLAIGLTWGVIVYCCMLLSDQLNIPWPLRPFVDALTAILIDLSLDAVVIRLGLWHWAIPLNEEWYGVPFDNLIGWILVVLVFSFLIRFIRTLNYKRFWTKILMVLSPLVAYFGLAVGIVLFDVFSIFPYMFNHWQELPPGSYKFGKILYVHEVQLWKLILLTSFIVGLVGVVVWSMFKFRRRYLRHFDVLAFSLITILHFYILFLVFYMGIFRREPYLGFLAFAIFGCHLFLHFLPYLIRPPKVYFFRDVEKGLQKEERLLEKSINKELK